MRDVDCSCGIMWYQEEPTQPNSGDMYYDGGNFHVYDGTKWCALVVSEDTIKVHKTESMRLEEAYKQAMELLEE